MEEKDQSQESQEESQDQPQQEPQQEQTAEAVEAPVEAPQVSQNAKNLGMLCHLLGFFTCFLAPLIIWLLKKDEDVFIDEHGKEALNFQISVALAMVASYILIAVCVGAALIFIVPIVDLVFCVIAAIRASSGQSYTYPLSLRLVK